MYIFSLKSYTDIRPKTNGRGYKLDGWLKTEVVQRLRSSNMEFLSTCFYRDAASVNILGQSVSEDWLSAILEWMIGIRSA